MKTVPIQLNSVKNIKGYQYTRFTFFYIENVEYLYAPEKRSFESIKNALILGAWGVLLGAYNGDEFNSADLINKTFAEIEELEYASIDLGHIWVPNFAIKSKNGMSLKKGHVYRITDILFKKSYQFNLNSITLEQLNKSYREVEEGIWYSEKETKAFIEWRKNQIDVSRKKYWSKEQRTKILGQKNIK